MNEISRVKRFIHAALVDSLPVTALVGERIFADVQPQPAEWPAVVFGVLSSPDTTANGGTRVVTRPLVLVRAITEGHGQEMAEQLADAIDDALQAAVGQVAGYGAYVAGVVREDAFDMVEESEGKIYRHLGGRYRVAIHAA